MEMSKLLDRTPRQIYHYLQRRISQSRQREEFPDNNLSMFVLSSGRVGTQTLSALFQLKHHVFVYHEPKPNLYALSKLAYKYSGQLLEYEEVWQEAFMTARKDLINHSFNCNKGYIETSPQTTFLAPVILQVIPNVRFIHVVRDPRFVVRSGMRRKWYEGHLADRTRIVPHSESEAGQKWETYTPFKKNLWLWAETNRWIMDFFSILPNEQKITIHSEDIFAADQETIEKIFSFISASVPSKNKILGVVNKRLNAQKRGDFPTPDQWTEAMDIELRVVAGETAKALGYRL